MKEKILRFLRKAFRASVVFGRLLAKLIPIVLVELRTRRLRTDAEIREFVVELVKAEIAASYPGYEFLIDAIIDAIIDAVRDRIRKHSVN